MKHKPVVSKETDIKAHLEAIAGRKIDLPVVPIGPINLIYLLGAFVGTTGGLEFPTSGITWRNLSDDVTHGSTAPLLDVSGIGSTDSTGKSVFRLSTFLGGEVDPNEPVNIVATPWGAVPFFLTAEHTFVNNAGGWASPDDIEITVSGWDPTGNPGANVVFEWRCRFLSDIVS